MNYQLLFFTIALMVAPVVFGNSINHPTIVAAPLSMHPNSSMVNGTLCHNASDASPVTTEAPSTTSLPSRVRRSLEDAVKSIFPGSIHITTTEAPLPNSTHNDSLVVIKRDVDCEHPGHQHGNAPHHTGSGPRPGMMHPLPHRQGHPNMPTNSTMVPHGHVKVTTVKSVPASNVTAAPLSTTSEPLTTDVPAPATDAPSTTAVPSTTAAPSTTGSPVPSTTGAPVIVVRRSLDSHMQHLNLTSSSEPCHNETTTPAAIRVRRSSGDTQQAKFSKVMKLVDTFKLQDCVARVICDLNCQPDGFGDDGKKVLNLALTLQSSGSLNESEVRTYINAGLTGRKYRQANTCALCTVTFTNCQANTTDLIDVISLIKLDA